MGSGHDPPHGAAPRDAHRRLPPLRARRRPRRDPGRAEPRGARLLVEFGRRNVAPGSSTRTASVFRFRSDRVCGSRGCACSRATTARTLDFAEEALAAPGFPSERKGKRLAVSIPALPARRRARRRSGRGGPARLRLRPAAVAPAPGHGPGGIPRAAAPGRGPLERRGRGGGSLRDGELSLRRPRRGRSRLGDWLRIAGDGARASLDRQPSGRPRAGTCVRRFCRGCSTPWRATSAAARRDGALRGRPCVWRPGRARQARVVRIAAFRLRARGRVRAHWSVPEKLRAADFFDAKGLVERLLAPWRPRPSSPGSPPPPAASPGAAATFLRPAPGDCWAIAGLVAGPEREKRALPAPVFAGEIRRRRDPERAARAFVFEEFPALPAITADLSFAQPKSLMWERSRGVRARRSSRISSRCGASIATRRAGSARRGPGQDDDPTDVSVAGADARAGRDQSPGSAPCRGARLAAGRHVR